jgi:putative PEP-CTERM system TPR-repeat lipoprotein
MAQLRAWGIVDPRVSFLRALLAKRRGDTQSARAEYAAVVNLIDSVPAAVRSNSEMLLMSGALSHRALGNQEKAREYLEALLARNARSFSAQLMLASVLVDTREYGRAMTVLETLRVAAPDEPNVLFLIASVYSARKQYVQAAELFERSARANPGGDAVRELALSQIGLGQDKTALANLEKAYAQNPRDQRAGTELAVSYARLGQADKAVQTAEAIVKGDPDNLAMLNFLGTTKGLVGDLAGAKSTYEKALAKDPLFRPSAINLNWMDIDAGRLDVARPRLQKLLLQKADDAELLFQLGVLESKARKPQAAIDAWTKANDVPRTDPRAGMALIDLYASQRMNDKVLALAKGLAARFPGSVGIQLALARASFAGGDAALGRGALVEATRLAAFDSTQQVLIGRTQLQYGNTEGALLNARKALESRPDDRDALVLMVEIEAKRNNATAVNAALKNLTARHPDSPATQLATGGVAMSRGQFPAAVTAFRAALAKDPNPQTAVMLSQALIANKEGEKAQSLLTDWAAKRPNDVISLQALSEVQMYLGNSAAARSTYAKIVALEPENPAAQANYAVLLLRLNDPTAVAAAEKAYRLAPSNPDYADVYGWLLALQGRPEAAVPVLREARLRDPGNGNLRYHLAFALQAAGRKVEAKEELGAVLGGPAKMPITPEVMKLKAELGL